MTWFMVPPPGVLVLVGAKATRAPAAANRPPVVNRRGPERDMRGVAGYPTRGSR